MTLTIPREQTFGKVDHPDTLKGLVRHGDGLVLVVGDVNTWIRSDLDDERYALYNNARCARWDLFRLEHDGVYRREASATGNLLDAYHTVVRTVREHDARRGFNLVDHLEREEARVERAQEREQSDFRQDFADHYLHRIFRKLFH